MTIEQNISLKPFNTFGIEATAKYFVSIKKLEDLQSLLNTPIYQQNPKLILGGGSNVLITSSLYRV